MIIKELLFESKNIPWRSASALKERRLREFVTAEKLSNNVELMIQLLGSKLTNEEVVLLGKLLSDQEVLDEADVAEVIEVLLKTVPDVARVTRQESGYIVNYPSNYSNYIKGSTQNLWYSVEYRNGKWVFTMPHPNPQMNKRVVRFDDEQDLLTHIKKFHKMVEKHKT
jgi:hypothetical protein